MREKNKLVQGVGFNDFNGYIKDDDGFSKLDFN